MLLTIGDGLVAQIPSLLLHFQPRFVTRVTTDESMAEQASKQIADPNGVFIASGIVTLLGLIPGMPHFVFLPLGAAGIGLGFYIRQQAAEQQRKEVNADAIADVEPATRELDWEDIDQVEVIALDIGYGLVPLANTQSGGQLLTRIRGIRKKLSAELGFLIQPIRIRDNLDLKPEMYQISLHGVVRATGDVRVGKLLAINSSDMPAPIDGEPTTEPAFGLDALWIESSQAELARGLGYTVVDAPTPLPLTSTPSFERALTSYWDRMRRNNFSTKSPPATRNWSAVWYLTCCRFQLLHKCCRTC